MLNKLTTLMGAAALSVMGSMGSMGAAASLDLKADNPTLISDSFLLDVIDNGGGDFVFTGTADFDAASGITPDGAANIFFEGGIFISGPDAVISTFGTLDVSDDFGSIAEGALSGFGYTDTSLEFLFDVTGGDYSDEFGPLALVEFMLAPGSTATFLSGLNDGDVLAGTLTVSGSVAPIPLPAGLPLLAAGLAGFAFMRRQQKA